MSTSEAAAVVVDRRWALCFGSFGRFCAVAIHISAAGHQDALRFGWSSYARASSRCNELQYVDAINRIDLRVTDKTDACQMYHKVGVDLCHFCFADRLAASDLPARMNGITSGVPVTQGARPVNPWPR